MVNVIVFHAASCLGPQGWFAGSARGVGNPYLGIILGLPVIRSEGSTYSRLGSRDFDARLVRPHSRHRPRRPQPVHVSSALCDRVFVDNSPGQ
jgi:hypothetical protein